MTPQYTHYCQQCLFLGQAGKFIFDMYYCYRFPRPTLIVRYGNLENMFARTWAGALHDLELIPEFKIALIRLHYTFLEKHYDTTLPPL